MSATANRTLLRIRADELEVGDQISEPGIISLTVTGVRVHEAHALVAVDYTCFGGSAADSRAYAITQPITVHRIEVEAL